MVSCVDVFFLFYEVLLTRKVEVKESVGGTKTGEEEVGTRIRVLGREADKGVSIRNLS